MLKALLALFTHPTAQPKTSFDSLLDIARFAPNGCGRTDIDGSVHQARNAREALAALKACGGATCWQ